MISQKMQDGYMQKGKIMIDTMYYNSPIGRLLLAEKEDALAGLWIEGQKYFLGSVREDMQENPNSTVLNQTKKWLDRYFNGERPAVKELALAPGGSEFGRAVWRLLCEIPYGKVTTYGALSKKIAAERKLDRMAAQAVGGAVGRNPISIIIPCHRVVGADGGMTGYGGGIDRKRRLLMLEGVDPADCTGFFV